MLAVIAVLVGWLLVVAPALYVVHLVCGAWARNRGPTKLVYHRAAGKVWEMRWIPRDETAPAGYEEAGYSTSPVTFTGLIAAGLLYLLGRAV